MSEAARRAALSGHAAMLLFAATISVSFSLGDRAAPFIDPGALTALRMGLASVALGLLAGPAMRRCHARALWRYAILGALLAGYFILMFEALRRTDPISTAAVFTLTPILSAVFGRVILGQVTTARTGLALALAALGALWVIFRADLDALLALRLGPGERLFLAGCALHALYPVLSRRWNDGVPVRVFTFGVVAGAFAAAALCSAPALVATAWAALPPLVWGAVAYLALAATALTVLLVQFATLRLPSAKVMAYGYLVPSFVILWEGLFAAAWPAAPVWAGVALTLAALLLLLARDAEA